MPEDPAYWHAINIATNASPMVYKLYEFFDTGKAAWEARATEIQHAGAGEEITERLKNARAKIDVFKEYEKLHKKGITIITQKNKTEYPSLLAHITNPPPLIYCRGRVPKKDIPFPIAVVGSRKATKEGLHITESLCADLVRAGCTVISGLALGIDAQAHKQALAQNAPTIAVLGSGVSDSALYPKFHVRLAHEIIEKNGCLLSEFPPDTKAERGYFPRRNRIIAGLSVACVVIQAGYKSGALITARHSLEENREVMAVPGSVYVPQYQGTNALIKRGAHLVQNAKDVLEVLGISPLSSNQKMLQTNTRSLDEQAILNALKQGIVTADDIAKHTRLPASSIARALTTLEIDGMIKNIGSGAYALARL